MSGSLGQNGPKYSTWQDAALGGNLLSYAWENRPGLEDFVPDSKPTDPVWRKTIDWGSVPARVLVNGLLEGPRVMDRYLKEGSSPEMNQEVTKATLGMALMGMGVSKPGFGTFGGPRAKGADLTALEQARAMESGQLAIRPVNEGKAGVGLASSPDEIWQTTGWFKDVDGNWKFEIPDERAKWTEQLRTNQYNPELRAVPFGSTPLSRLLEHPELYKHYPELAETPVSSTGMLAGFQGIKGGMTDDGKMLLTGGKPNEIFSTALHEGQHKIQQLEGFARGGNPNEFLPPTFGKDFDAAKSEVYKLREELRKADLNPFILEKTWGKSAEKLYPFEKAELSKYSEKFDPEHEARFKDATHYFNKLEEMRKEAFGKYQSLAGEVEARNVQERLEHGRTNAPWRTEGYPTEPQLVIMPNGDRFVVEPVIGNPFEGK